MWFLRTMAEKTRRFTCRILGLDAHAENETQTSSWLEQSQVGGSLVCGGSMSVCRGVPTKLVPQDSMAIAPPPQSSGCLLKLEDPSKWFVSSWFLLKTIHQEQGVQRFERPPSLFPKWTWVCFLGYPLLGGWLKGKPEGIDT